MADDEAKVTQSTQFKMGDRVVDAWGNDVEQSEDEEVGYDSWTAKQLMKELSDRNETRDESEQIVPEGTGKDGKVVKADVVKALQADDEAHADEEDEEE